MLKAEKCIDFLFGGKLDKGIIRSFFSGEQIAVSTCRAGNIIGGDFSKFRVIPDAKRAVEETVRWYRGFAEDGDMKKLTEFQIKQYIK